jgi:uncharacterized protein (TIGR00251 family)
VGWLGGVDGAVELELLVVPRASRSRLAGVHDDRLKIQVNAPPVDGEANAAVTALIARSFGVKRAAVTLVSGQTGRRKRVRIEGPTLAEVRERVERDDA